jgi:GntR family transcriptional repressor for pyruvate dehydrogenase complex
VQEIFTSIGWQDGILSGQVAQQIQELVKSGKLHEGDRLPSERELSEYLGVSRTVVREAIKILKATGMVRVRQGIGTFISNPGPDALEASLVAVMGSDPKMVEDLQQTREILEPQIAALAAAGANAEQIAEMERIVEEMAANTQDTNRFIHADGTFHVVLATATQNSILKTLVLSFLDLSGDERRVSTLHPGAIDRALYHHRRILEAIKKHDPGMAVETMMEHMKQVRDDTQIGLKRLSNSKKQIIQEEDTLASGVA